ncbi:hypothetical protein N9F34_02305 [Alphaproteobacteria bacterium]|nr:hypothetical protein [Alphaproteobacteria bacterium]
MTIPRDGSCRVKIEVTEADVCLDVAKKVKTQQRTQLLRNPATKNKFLAEKRFIAPKKTLLANRMTKFGRYLGDIRSNQFDYFGNNC